MPFHEAPALPARAADIAGHRFGRLVAQRYIGPYGGSGGAVWLCRCDCGETLPVLYRNLRSGGTHSCGCLRSILRSTVARLHLNAGGAS